MFCVFGLAVVTTKTEEQQREAGASCAGGWVCPRVLLRVVGYKGVDTVVSGCSCNLCSSLRAQLLGQQSRKKMVMCAWMVCTHVWYCAISLARPPCLAGHRGCLTCCGFLLSRACVYKGNIRSLRRSCVKCSVEVRCDPGLPSPFPSLTATKWHGHDTVRQQRFHR